MLFEVFHRVGEATGGGHTERHVIEADRYETVGFQIAGDEDQQLFEQVLVFWRSTTPDLVEEVARVRNWQYVVRLADPDPTPKPEVAAEPQPEGT